MLAIEVELLTGRYAATAHNDRSRAEWPPHPARLFSAFVAALHEHDPVDADERKALLWLESQQPPSLDVDLDIAEDNGRRSVLDVFVPVNDVVMVFKKVKGVEKLNASDPLSTGIPRTKQARSFPVIVPARPCFVLVWPMDVPTELRAALDRLCARVTRLGHSSSLVRCVIVDRPITPTLVPDENGDVVLRTVGANQLDRLETEFKRHQGVENRVLPAIPKRYGRLKPVASDPFAESVFSNDWIVFERIGGARLLSSRGTDLSRALRDSLLEQHGSKTLPASLSGHRQDGSVTDQPHIALMALPFVGHEHADASVKGCAIVVPREIFGSDRETLLRLIGTWERDRAIDAEGTMELAGEDLPTVRIKRIELAAMQTLRPTTWCRPAQRFITATPIALDRNPGNLRNNQHGAAHKASIEAQRYVADACERIGLPRPISVEVSLTPLLPGAQPVHAFPPWPNRPGRIARVRVHADILFAEKVRGPVLLGAGRFFGLGLCLPIHEEGAI